MQNDPCVNRIQNYSPCLTGYKMMIHVQQDTTMMLLVQQDTQLPSLQQDTT